jgi:hypothetical protein
VCDNGIYLSERTKRQSLINFCWFSSFPYSLYRQTQGRVIRFDGRTFFYVGTSPFYPTFRKLNTEIPNHPRTHYTRHASRSTPQLLQKTSYCHRSPTPPAFTHSSHFEPQILTYVIAWRSISPMKRQIRMSSSSQGAFKDTWQPLTRILWI